MKTIIPHNKLIAGILLSSILASIGLLGGLSLHLVKRDILQFLPLLVALPAMNAIAGNLASLTSAHLADPENYPKRTRKLILALVLSIPVCAIAISAMSLLVARLQGFEVGQEQTIEYTKALFFGLSAVMTIMFGIIYGAKVLLIKLQLNVEDTLIPIASTLTSVLMLLGFALIATNIT